MPPSNLDVIVLTPHGVPVPAASVVLAGGGQLRAGEESAPGRYALLLPCPGDYQLTISRFDAPGGFDHRTLRLTLFHLHRDDAPVLRLLRPPAGEPSSARLSTDADGFTLTVTLDYLWFTPIGTPPTTGNTVDLLIDGEEGWAAVAAAIAAAKTSVHVTTWMYEPTTELLRPDPLASPEDRSTNTIHALLTAAADRGATVRLLPWDAPVLSLPAEARAAGRTAGDNFEVMEQGNPTRRPVLNDATAVGAVANRLLGSWRIGSYHQKTAIIDGEVGFCGGMNLKENDWDASRHALFDPRRARFRRPSGFRRQVEAALQRPDHAPRHDYVARLTGPAVADLEGNFQQRWNHLIDRRIAWSEHATEVSDPVRAPGRGSSAVQVVRTMPEPFSERGILDVHLRALSSARQLIFIEDQYFRSTHVSDAIADAIRSWPQLCVIVVTIRKYAESALEGGWTQEAFERIQRRRPGFVLHELRTWGEDADGLHTEAIDNHSKLLIVDDIFLTVGSCNINDRGFEYEGEINVAVVDRPWVAAQRRAIWRLLLCDDPGLTGEIAGDVAVWEAHARDNAAALAAGSTPRSFVFPFVPQNQRARIVGRDVT